MAKIYEHNYTLPLVIALVVLALLVGVYFSMDGRDAPPEETTTEPVESTTEPEETAEPMPSISFKSDLSAFEEAMTASGDEYLMLVNKSTLLPSSHKPKSLVAVKDAKKEIELEATAERALEAMFIEMRACGYKDVFVTSAYRSYDYQVWLFNYYIEEEKAADRTLSDAEAREKVLRYSAAPGTSEHQSGLCVDLMTNGMRELDESFADEPVFEWLSENAWKFGFILRYPEDKVDVTLYDYEPWHYRFVGREAAYEIYRDGLCLEEYLAK
jgi:LAS superfamily LD-carboxypeptidase LdcB